jgi:KUP system potassium uptake protein
LTLADGVLTPAVSVVSAVEGISVAKPSVQGSIAGISIAIIGKGHYKVHLRQNEWTLTGRTAPVVLFLVQNFGTARISFLFAPVIAIWLLLLAGSGEQLSFAFCISPGYLLNLMQVSITLHTFRVYGERGTSRGWPLPSEDSVGRTDKCRETHPCSRAVSYFVRTKRFDDLAGVILCITGVEALFAKLVKSLELALTSLI